MNTRANRPPEESRTFESRVTFIRDLFENLYSRDQVMASCINYKLDTAYAEYVKDIHKSLWFLYGRNPLTILRKIDGWE